MSAAVCRQTSQVISLLSIVILFLNCGCGVSSAELEKARQAEAEARQRLQECEAELAQTRQALDAARHNSPAGRDADGKATEDWQAARQTAELFLEAINSRNAEAIRTVMTRKFQEQDGAGNALNVFSRGHFRGDAGGYKCALLTRLEAVPGKQEFVGRGGLLYRDVPRQDSSYTLRIVKEGEHWRVASFTAVER